MCEQDSLSLQDQFAHADQVLGDLGESLFTFVSDESRPVDQILVDLFQSFLVVLTELHLHKHKHTDVVVIIIILNKMYSHCLKQLLPNV